jgi:nicotinamide riboside transporter PnuC
VIKEEMSKAEATFLIKKTYKPRLTLPILMTIIGMVLFGGIFMDLSDGNYFRMGILVVLFGLSMLVMGLAGPRIILECFNIRKK